MQTDQVLNAQRETIRFVDYELLARKIAGKVWSRLRDAGASVDLADVMQEIALTFCIARDNFDPSLGWKFSTYFVRSAYNNINKFVEAEVNEVHLRLDGSDVDGDFGLHEVVAADVKTPESIALGEFHRAAVMRRMSPNTRKVVEILESPPPRIIEQLKAVQAKADFGRSLGTIGRRAAPSRVSIRFIMDVLGVSQAERGEIYREIALLVEKVNNE